MNPFAIALGAFIGAYFNNRKFRQGVDKTVNDLINKGINAVNQKGGEPLADESAIQETEQ